MVNQNIIMMIAMEAKEAASKAEGTLEQRLLAAMKSAKNNWMAPEEDEMIIGAVAGVAQIYGNDSNETRRLSAELRDIKKVNAMLMAMRAGLSIDSTSLTMENTEDPIIMETWRIAKQEG